LITLWRLICLPGYAWLWVTFYFPTEWGKKRNVSRTGRQWRSRHVFAPIYSVFIYGIIALSLLPDDVQQYEPSPQTQQSNQSISRSPEKSIISEQNNNNGATRQAEQINHSRGNSRGDGIVRQNHEKYDPTVFCRALGNCDPQTAPVPRAEPRITGKGRSEVFQPKNRENRAGQQSHQSSILQSLNNIELCKLAVRNDQAAWETMHYIQKYVEEAISRNLTAQKCFSLIGADERLTKHRVAEERPRNNINQNQEQYDPSVFCRAAGTCDPVSKIIETLGSSLIGVATKTLEMRTSNPNVEDEIIYDYPD